MRGFQPQHYADGGLVQRALGLIGGRKKQIDDAVKVASQDTRQASAPAPAPVKTTPDGKFDEKRASKDNPAGIGFADGGMVRGPGTGTSDDVPDEVPEGTYIMPADSTEAIGAENLESAGARGLPMPGGKKVPVALSNGEFKLPPEQVHAVGVQALDQIKNATHKPVRGFAPQAAPEQPRQFFANGGYVKRLHLADAGVVTRKRLEEEGQVPNAATSPSNIFPGNRLPGDSGSTSAPPPVAPSTSAPPATAPSTLVDVSAGTLPQEQGDPFLSTPKARAGLTQGQQPTAAPSAPTAPAPADPGGFSYADNNKAVGQDIKDSWNKGNYGEAVGKTVAGSVGMFTTPIIDVATRGGAAAWDGAKGFASGLFGMESPSVSATPAKPAGTASQVPATSQTEPSGTNPAAAAKPAPQPARAPDATTETAAEKPPQVMPGVYQHGRGQYSDQAQGMGFSPGFTGQPSAQNMAAADALAQRSQAEAMNRVARGFDTTGAAPAAPAAPSSGGENFDWMKDLRDPRTLALRNASVGSTIFRNKGEEMTANKARQARVASVQAAIGSQMHDAQQADTARYQSGNTLAGNIATEQMRQAGENQRSARGLAVAQQRLGIEAGKAAQESTARGFDIRAAQRQEALYQKYDAAKTPEEKSAIAQQIRDLSGKQAESPWKIQVTPATKNADGSTSDGSIYRYNTQTGAVERVDGGVGNPSGPPAPKSKAEYDALPKGAQYIKDGKVLVKS